MGRAGLSPLGDGIRMHGLEELLLEGLESGEGVEVTPEYFAERRRALKARLSQRDDKNG